MKSFEKYKPESIRLKNYDYSLPGEYFVTVCAKDRLCFFGEINEESEMVLSEMGKVAEKYWLEIPKHFPNTELDIFQIMPNHVHGMVRIVDQSVETCHGMSLHDNFKNEFGKMQKNSLSAVVNHFKGAVTRYANKNNREFQWQSNYYEEIIRDERHYNEVYTYIESNPQTRDRDKNNPKSDI
jgi:putative transposase